MKTISHEGHEFSFHEGGVEYSHAGHKKIVSFDTPLRLVFSWRGNLSLQGKDQIPLFLMPKDQQQKFLLDICNAWMKRNPEAAKKALFDYTDAQKGFVGIALGVSLFLCLPMAIGFLNDSREQYQCAKELHQSSANGVMNVIKVKKKRKGHYLLELQFTTPSGEIIRGTDQAITEDETAIPKEIPVVYSPSHPKCWSLTRSLEGHEPNWAKMRYFSAFTLLFGSFFLFVSLFGATWSGSRFIRKRPYVQELRSLIHL